MLHFSVNILRPACVDLKQNKVLAVICMGGGVRKIHFYTRYFRMASKFFFSCIAQFSVTDLELQLLVRAPHPSQGLEFVYLKLLLF